jgi:hypothetical protein
MQPIDVKGALAHLVTRPTRPRYQERTMHAGFVGGDAGHARSGAERRLDMVARIDSFATGLAQSTAGTVQTPKGPLVAGSLLLLVLGASAFLR